MTASNMGSLNGKALDLGKIKAVFQDMVHPAPSAGRLGRRYPYKFAEFQLPYPERPLEGTVVPSLSKERKLC